MREIKVGDYVAIVDDADYELASRFEWWPKPHGRTIYARAWRGCGGKTQKLLHRLILGLTDPRQVVDHINKNGLDNRRCNLRVGTHKQNLSNVHFEKGFERLKSGRFRARIALHSRDVQLGIFNTETEALAAYLAARKVKEILSWSEQER